MPPEKGGRLSKIFEFPYYRKMCFGASREGCQKRRTFLPPLTFSPKKPNAMKRVAGGDFYEPCLVAPQGSTSEKSEVFVATAKASIWERVGAKTIDLAHHSMWKQARHRDEQGNATL